eukprot:TRINITY_DN16972_c0_g4_i1.p1 TRINITY_DN16972_c0_g4~~TRINITY_DN16972_c0_g4_i1.p1  ORF type:complete len:652 (+),score=153.67 TRINITY_DN16972_c0_g4_i1:131-2086(+)
MTVRDSEDAESRPTVSMDIKRRYGERAHSRLLRVRSEFNQFNRWFDEHNKVKGFYSDDFERWRQRRLNGDVSDEEDYRDLPLRTRGAQIEMELKPSRLQARFDATVDDQETEPPLDWPTELDFPPAMIGHPPETSPAAKASKIPSKVTFSLDIPKSGDEDDPEDGENEDDAIAGETEYGDPEVDPDDAILAIMTVALPKVNWTEEAKQKQKRPASAPGRARKSQAPAPSRNPVKRAYEEKMAKTLKPVSHDEKASERQTKRLGLAYKSASATDLASAAAAAAKLAQSEEDAAMMAKLRDQKRAKKQQETDEDIKDQGSDESRLAAVIEKLRHRGLKAVSGGGASAAGGDADSKKRATSQWIRQLAEDYPDEFCQVSRAGIPGTLVPPSAHLQNMLAASDHDEAPKLQSMMWVLNLHGNPLRERDWVRREVWLSPAGRLWYGAVEGQGPAPASLQLGGENVTELQILRARQGIDTIAVLHGRQIYGIRIDLPGARYTRRRYIATDDEDVCEEWFTVMTTPIVRTQERDGVPATPASGSRTELTSPTRSHVDSIGLLSPSGMSTQIGWDEGLTLTPTTTMSAKSLLTPKTPGAKSLQGSPIKGRKLSSPDLRRTPQALDTSMGTPKSRMFTPSAKKREVSFCLTSETTGASKR